jgi:hypothetical protein
VGWVGIQDTATQAQYGNTIATDYQIRFYLKKWNLESFYQTYQGYYLANSGDAFSNYNWGNPRYQLPNMQTQHYGLVATYKFNFENFSSSAGFDQFERQKSSGGSWLLSVAADFFSFSNPGTFVPSALSGQYGDFEQFNSGKISTLALGFGYGYDLLIYTKFFLAAQGVVSTGATSETLGQTTGNPVYSSGAYSPEIHAKAAVGYNGEHFIASIRINEDSVSAPVRGVNLNYSAQEAAFYVGWHWQDVNLSWLNWNQLNEAAQ